MSVMTSQSNDQKRKMRNASALLPHSWFATDEIEPKLRHEAWRQTVGVCLDSSLSHGEPAEKFTAVLEGYLLDGIVFSRPQATRQKFDRSSLKIARDSVDHYMIELFLRGHMEMQVHSRTIRNRPGQIVCFDLGDVLDSFNSNFDLLCVFIPREQLAPLLDRPDSLHGVMPDIEVGPGLLLAQHLRTLYRALPTLSPADAPSTARALLELTAAAFNRAIGGNNVYIGGRHHSLLLRAQQFIRENLAVPTLSVEDVALGIGVSRTLLYQLFEPIGGVAVYVREMRLRKCLKDVTAVGRVKAPIAEIGYRCGFTDPSAFARAFRQRFGSTPSEVREFASLQSGRNPTAADSFMGDRAYEEWIAGLRISKPM